MTPRDTERLQGVHPDLIAILETVFAAQEAAGTPMFVVQGVRTVAQQQALYAQGRTTPGKIVTMKDGITHPSNHQPHADGFGHAVDCAFVGGDPEGPKHDWEAYGTKLEAAGLIWGGRWHFPHDSPHAELPDKTSSMGTKCPNGDTKPTVGGAQGNASL
jgi:peptidoglycan L-alanyl-D-glutamate endopeptidase CwlK